jgi:hypothetical protein
VTRRSTLEEPWGAAESLGDLVNSPESDRVPQILFDERVLLFHSERSGSQDIYMCTRPDSNVPFSEPVKIGSTVNSFVVADPFYCPQLGIMLFSHHSDESSYDIWKVNVAPVKMFPDLNSDFLINFKDFSILAQKMGSESEIYDISPPPIGDGVVNSVDMAGLVYCWLKGYKAGNPSPSDGAIEVSPIAELSWTAGFDAVSHDVYFGTSDPPPFIQNQIDTTFNPFMSYETTYYWRIDEINEGGTTVGNIWSFTTQSGPPPPPPIP